MLLSKHSALLTAAEDDSRRNDARVLSTKSLLRGSLAWLVMGACAVYALVAVVDEELAFQYGTARVTLVITQVCAMVFYYEYIAGSFFFSISFQFLKYIVMFLNILCC